MSALPRTRPHRRSGKRAARPGEPPKAKPPAAKRPQPARETRARSPGERLRQPPQPAGTPAPPRPRKPVPASGVEILSTAVQAAAELAEIGLSLSARALRNAVSRLPKP